MMRTDVKLGFAIGGVLLAVLVVYVLVVSGHDNKKTQQVGLVTQGSEPGVSFPADHPDTASAGGTSVAIDPSAKHDPQLTGPATQPLATDQPKTGGDDKWSSALSSGKLPLMMSETPSKPAERLDPPVKKPADDGLQIIAKLDHINFGGVKPRQPEPASDSLPPATQPVAAARTHVVASGETLSSIAATAYGNATLYPHLLRANPNLDPKKMKAGTTINIPPLEASTSDAVATSTVSALTASHGKQIDVKSQYVVQSGDSLYSISKKLYGKADHVDKLFDTNKALIGADRQALKVGMVLTLPDAPVSH